MGKWNDRTCAKHKLRNALHDQGNMEAFARSLTTEQLEDAQATLRGVLFFGSPIPERLAEPLKQVMEAELQRRQSPTT